jgi:hypothetical protein
MKTNNQIIPAASSPDTAFAIPIQPVNGGNGRAEEKLMPLRLFAASENEFTPPGIPDSALNDF